MTIKIYDSLSQQLQEFKPLKTGDVSMYVCGPTVQSAPHIGHLRSALVYDLWRRWFRYSGYRVTLVRNVTDIDDKILEKAAEAGTDWRVHGYRYEQEFSAAYAKLGVLPPSYEPRATGYISQQLELIQRLIDRGYAYPAEDGSGDVYFSVTAWPEYGQLTRQKLDELADAGDADPRGKRDPRDFALWKGHKQGEAESASWPTPWGRGRPGWHIECSAMAGSFFGGEFDIHGGGLDLRFPHHENELAQSRAAGDSFASYWVHNAMVNVAGQKMSKSLGNSVFAADLQAAAEPAVLRYLLATAHYRSILEYHESSIAEARAALGRILGFLKRAQEALGEIPEAPVSENFSEAMDDDLNVPLALSAIHDRVRMGNVILARGKLDDTDTDLLGIVAGPVQRMAEVLGLIGPDIDEPSSEGQGILDELVRYLIELRAKARTEKDFARADEIRDLFAQAGITVEDGAEGTRWSVQ